MPCHCPWTVLTCCGVFFLVYCCFLPSLYCADHVLDHQPYFCRSGYVATEVLRAKCSCTLHSVNIQYTMPHGTWLQRTPVFGLKPRYSCTNPWEQSCLVTRTLRRDSVSDVFRNERWKSNWLCRIVFPLTLHVRQFKTLTLLLFYLERYNTHWPLRQYI